MVILQAILLLAVGEYEVLEHPLFHSIQCMVHQHPLEDAVGCLSVETLLATAHSDAGIPSMWKNS